MSDRISSFDAGYRSGDLSLYPDVIDDTESLYEASNNAVTQLQQTFAFNSKTIVVESTENFPDNGILRIGPLEGENNEYEMIYYGKKTRNSFQDIKRGFKGSRPNKWLAKQSYASNAVFSEHHNAVKDAIIQLQKNLGLKIEPEEQSLNGILKRQELRFLAPKPLFRAFPIKGVEGIPVRFQNFTTGHIARFIWDFGDGSTSLEKNPTHVYVAEGRYTVKLNVITTTGSQGIAKKTNYITIDNQESIPYFYVDDESDPYSMETANLQELTRKEFRFIDQSEGEITQRNWIFGDGTTFTELDSDNHEITHIYEKPGNYTVTEIIQFKNNRLKKAELPYKLIVL